MSAGNDGLTPPGPPSDPGDPGDPAAIPSPPPAAAGNPYYGAPHLAATPPPATDKGLGWTAFGIGIFFCIPCLPLVAVVLAIITLARGRFRPRWVAVVALVAGLAGTGLQVAALASPDFWDGVRDGIDDSMEEQADEARRSGEPAEISTLKLREGDCFDDDAITGVEGDEQVESQTVTLIPCRDRHSLQVYETLSIKGEDFPGQAAIDRRSRACFPAFADFVGKPYAQSELEVWIYFPTKQSWSMLDDRVVLCLVGHPKHSVRGTLQDSRR